MTVHSHEIYSGGTPNIDVRERGHGLNPPSFQSSYFHFIANLPACTVAER